MGSCASRPVSVTSRLTWRTAPQTQAAVRVESLTPGAQEEVEAAGVHERDPLGVEHQELRVGLHEPAEQGQCLEVHVARDRHDRPRARAVDGAGDRGREPTPARGLDVGRRSCSSSTARDPGRSASGFASFASELLIDGPARGWTATSARTWRTPWTFAPRCTRHRGW